MDTSTPADTSAAESPELEWFYTQRGETFGPVSSADLRAAAHLGFLGPDDMVCRKDRGRWVSARSIRGLFKGAV
jgi:hypothetical protein